MLFPLPGSLPEPPLPNATFQAPPLPPRFPQEAPILLSSGSLCHLLLLEDCSLRTGAVGISVHPSHWAQSCSWAGLGADGSVSPSSIEVDEERRKRDGMKTVSPEDGGEIEAGTQRNSHKPGECFTQKGSRVGLQLSAHRGQALPHPPGLFLDTLTKPAVPHFNPLQQVFPSLLSKNEIFQNPYSAQAPLKVKAALMEAMAQQTKLQHEGLWTDLRRNLLAIRAQPLKYSLNFRA